VQEGKNIASRRVNVVLDSARMSVNLFPWSVELPVTYSPLSLYLFTLLPAGYELMITYKYLDAALRKSVSEQYISILLVAYSVVTYDTGPHTY